MALDMQTAQRWQRAAQRALAADLPGDLVRRGGSVLVASQTVAGKRHRVQLVAGTQAGQCDCEAGLAGKPCAHRAAVAIRLYERETGTRVVAVKPGAALGMERYLYRS